MRKLDIIERYQNYATFSSAMCICTLHWSNKEWHDSIRCRPRILKLFDGEYFNWCKKSFQSIYSWPVILIL